MPESNKNSDDKDKTCPRCKGTGSVESRYYNLTTGKDEIKQEPCMLCSGTGFIDD